MGHVLVLAKLIAHFIGNTAIKFTYDEGTVSIISEKKDNQAIVSIKDTGRGIDAEMRYYKSYFQNLHPNHLLEQVLDCIFPKVWYRPTEAKFGIKIILLEKGYIYV